MGARMSAAPTPVESILPPLLVTESPHALVLRWLVPLRFLAAAGQAAALVFASQVMRVDLPYRWLWLIPAATLLSNLVLLRRGWSTAQAQLLAPATLIFDTFLFTALLYLTGGPDNPFSALYTVHVAMAAMTGSARATWLIAGLSAAGYAAVFRWHQTYHFWHGPIAPGMDVGLHAVGMWVAVTVVAIVITYFIGSITNTLRAQEASLRRVGELAARNARLASLTTLAAGAAHELGSPLGTIAVIAGELAREADRSPGLAPWADDARLLRAEVDRCRAILDRMSARADRVGASGDPPLHAKEIRALLGADEIGADAERLDVDVYAPPETDLGARSDFSAVVVPLVQNAFAASPAGERVRVTVAREGDRVRVSVLDRGHGMSADVLERASEPFFTTRSPGQGTGLGLFVLRLHTERLGGTLQLSSNPGTGTTATVEWPVSPASPTLP
jgi:two-component system sensor histidine kinase RegB